MGRDNQPKDRQRRKLARKVGRRPPYDRVLIVCEGTETEPNYFEEIRKYGRLPSAHVVATPGGYGPQPLKVVEYACDRCETDNRWEKVFCVFDRDDHTRFEEALARVREKDGKTKNDQGEGIRFIAIPSVPCFELWFLLHFEGILHEISRSDLAERLERFMPGYEKGAGDHFDRTKHLLDEAYKHCARLARNRSDATAENPFTAVDEVVKTLMKLIELRRSCAK